jgi:hypothetical protein
MLWWRESRHDPLILTEFYLCKGKFPLGLEIAIAVPISFIARQNWVLH